MDKEEADTMRRQALEQGVQVIEGTITHVIIFSGIIEVENRLEATIEAAKLIEFLRIYGDRAQFQVQSGVTAIGQELGSSAKH